jgi:uncharacterized protein (DUF305 family)
VIRLATVLVATALAATGCSESAGTTPPPQAPAKPAAAGATFNAADVMFAQMMVPHHKQGIDITGLAGTRASNSEVKTLAAAISVTQLTEVETMSGWLRSWKKPATATSSEHDAHGGMPGTSNIEIRSLKAKSGNDFDRGFLNMLIAHQDDAIQMARAEVADGQHPEAKALAGRIDKSRSAQITQMLALLDKLPS